MPRKTLVSLASALTLFAGTGCPINCVARGTRVRVRGGWTEVEALTPGDEVLSVDPSTGESSWTRIVEIRSAKRECVRLSTSRGELVCTSDHPIWSPEREEFTDAGNWALGYLSKLTRCTEVGLETIDVSNTSVFAGVNEVFDLVLDDDPHTFVAEGFLVHNKSPACVDEFGSACMCEDGRSGEVSCSGGCDCSFSRDMSECAPNAGAQCVCSDGTRSVIDCAGECECEFAPNVMTRDMSLDAPLPDGGTDGGGADAADMAQTDVVITPNTGLITVDPDNASWFVYDDGTPHFLCGPGDPEGFLYRGDRQADGTRDGDQQQLLDKLAGTGANGIYMQIIRSHGGDGGPSHNPFVDSDPANGLDDAILTQWAGWFDTLDANGIVTYLFIYDDSASVWDTGDTVGAEEEAFLQEIVDRFERYDHLVWVVAEEYSEALSPARASAIAQVIRDADDRGHPIGVHKLGGLDFSEFALDPNVDQFTIQYNVGDADSIHAGMVQAFADANGQYNLNMSESADHGTGATARHKNWGAAMGGAYVMALGWDIASTPLADLRGCGYLVRFMEASRVNETSPRDDLAFGNTEWVLAAPPEVHIAYSRNAQGTLGIAGLEAGTHDLRWLDTVSGETVVLTGVDVDAGDNQFQAPDGFGDELALSVIRSE